MKKTLTVFIAVALLAGVSGCSTIKGWFGDNDDSDGLTVHPAERTPEMQSYLDRAGAKLGMEYGGGWEVYFEPATHYPGGKAAIDNGHGDLVGGYADPRKLEVRMATYGEGGPLGPLTGEHEIGHMILFENNVPLHKHHKIMEDAGI